VLAGETHSRAALIVQQVGLRQVQIDMFEQHARAMQVERRIDLPRLSLKFNRQVKVPGVRGVQVPPFSVSAVRTPLHAERGGGGQPMRQTSAMRFPLDIRRSMSGYS
jgi:hypothetical protein